MVTTRSCLLASAVLQSPAPLPLLLATHDPCPALAQGPGGSPAQGPGGSPAQGPGGSPAPSSAAAGRRQKAVALSLAPWLSHWARAVCDVIHTLAWSDVVIVADRTLLREFWVSLAVC